MSAKQYKANKETSIYGFKTGCNQIATESGQMPVPSEDSRLTMEFSYNLYCIELLIYKNGLVSRTTKAFHLLAEAKEEYNKLKKQHKFKIVDQAPKSAA